MLDLRTALRTLARRPGFSLWIIAIFAAGIAANTVVFSLFNGLFLRAFPFPQPERLFFINESAPSRNLAEIAAPYEDLESWSSGSGAFESIAGLKEGDGAYLSGAGQTLRVKVASVTYNMAATLGVHPMLGRNFLPEEDRKGMGKVLLLRYEFWQRQFGGSPDAIGKIVQLDNTPFTIVGVLPRAAIFPGAADLWMPLGPYFPGEKARFLNSVGRLRSGITLDQARADLTRIHKGLVSTRPNNKFTQPVIVPLREHYLGDYRPLARVIFGAVIFVLFIACVNVAGLMLARGTARARELAIRQALGAGRGRLIGQLMAESLLLAVAGGIAGTLFSWMVLRAILSAMPDLLPSWVDFNIDARIAVFALLATAATGLLAGLFPAIQSSNVSVGGFLVDATPKASLSTASRRAMNSLVIGEIAVAMVLLAAGGLILKAFRQVLSTDPGFRVAGIITFNLDPPLGNPPDGPRITRFYDGLLARLRLLPGVDAAGAVAVYGLPMGGVDFKWPFIVEGVNPPPAPNQPAPLILHRNITPGYFRAMGISLRAGREFDEHDGGNGGTAAVIVNEAFARSFWPGDLQVTGKRIARPSRDLQWMTVVGLVKDVRDDGLDHERKPVVYLPYREHVYSQMSVVIHSAIDPGSQAVAAREIVQQMDPTVTLFNVRTMQDIVDRSLWLRRAYSWLFGVFAAFGMMLALAGIYGVVSYTVTQRTREIGIRMALGAEPRRVLAQVVREGMINAAVGSAVGLLIATFSTRYLQSLLAGVSPNDPWVLATGSLLLAAAALAANVLPARRAASINPVEALRFEA